MSANTNPADLRFNGLHTGLSDGLGARLVLLTPSGRVREVPLTRRDVMRLLKSSVQALEQFDRDEGTVGVVVNMSRSSVEPPSPPPAHSTPPEEHTIYFHSRSDGFNIFWRATCACGWESGDCGEEVAGLAADEHLRPFERIALP